MRMHHGLVARLLEAEMRRSLRASFQRVEWAGPWPEVPPDRSVVLLCNHPSFYDGYLGWLVARRPSRRRALTWMQEWDRFPFFAAVGALPFPKDDPHTRAATIRRTARLFEGPGYALVYFPEGRLHPPEEGILPFDEGLLARLDRLLPARTWLPMGIHLTWDVGPHPVARLGAGAPTPTLQGDEHARLAALVESLRQPDVSVKTLVEGARPPQERWNFRPARAFFQRYR
jgi:1-acyl-sn-glycerol-3-phosphate acyltransferase